MTPTSQLLLQFVCTENIYIYKGFSAQQIKGKKLNRSTGKREFNVKKQKAEKLIQN